MAMSREQAMAFLEALVGSPKTKVHLEAILGWQKSPAMEDFLSREEGAIDRCEDLIAYLEETTGILRVLHDTRARQAEIGFDGDKASVVGKFFLSLDGDLWIDAPGPFENVEKAEAAARESFPDLEPGDWFWIGQATMADPPSRFRVHDVIADLNYWAVNQGIGEWPVLSDEQVHELEAAVNALIKQRITEAGQLPKVYYKKVKQSEIPAAPVVEPLPEPEAAAGEVANRTEEEAPKAQEYAQTGPVEGFTLPAKKKRGTSRKSFSSSL